MKITIRISSAVLLGILTFGCSYGFSLAPPPPPPPLNCYEGQIPKPGGGYWTCSFDEEFNGTTLNTSQWTPQLTSNSAYTTGTPTAAACYVNTPNNISVSGGYLHLTAREESAPFACTYPGGSFTTQYTSGMVTAVYGFHQTYGRFEIRAKLPNTAVEGLQETLWLYPVNLTYGAWPASGEIDLAEFYSEYATLDIPYIHYNYDPSTVNPATNTNIVTAYTCSIDYTQFNTYTMVWEPGTITLMYNGNTCLIDNYVPDAGLTSPEPFNQPFFIALTQALGGVGTNAFTPGTTPLPATLQIDYARVWK
jgi:beta-glucanase (GH16 family)